MILNRMVNQERKMIMKNFRAKRLNKKASSTKNSPDKVIESIELKPGQTIADIGSGGGYFSQRFAELVGEEGKVYAVDTDPGYLEFVKKSVKEKGLNNVIPTLATEDRLDLAKEGLDFIFMRNVTHHLEDRVGYFKNLKDFLKPDGRIIIIDYKPARSFSFHRIFGHFLPREIITQELDEAGYLLEKEFDFLPEQHFMIYSKR